MREGFRGLGCRVQGSLGPRPLIRAQALVYKVRAGNLVANTRALAPSRLRSPQERYSVGALGYIMHSHNNRGPEGMKLVMPQASIV